MLASDKFWTLKEAVYYLCWTLNEGERHFANPTRDDLNLLDASTSLLQDVTIPLGTFLPEALDRLLNPYNFGWRVDYVRRGVRSIAIFRRGVGVQKRIRIQPPGSDIDPTRTTISACELGVGNQSLVNQIRAVGDFKLYEATWELKKGWSESKDDEPQETLSESSVEWATNPALHNVRRLFVLNEGGDHIGVRPDIRSPYNFAGIFDVPTVPRRRRFFPCITLDKDRLPVGDNGYFVEYSDGTSDPELGDWRPISGFEVLASECGIRFNGDVPPEEFMAANIKVRITASVYSDERIEYEKAKSPLSAQPDSVPVFLDVSDRFHYRTIHSTSRFASQTGPNGLYEHSKVDDTTKLQEFVGTLVKSMDQLDVSATVVVPNLNVGEYNIGDVIPRMDGRDFDFEIKSIAGNRFPQITGIQYDCINHRRSIALETFRDTSYR
jgi:hypothetical protein